MTKKIVEKRLGRAMDGALMLFEQTFEGKKQGYSIGRFTSNLTRYGRGVEGLGRAMYYFVPSGKYGGGGTLSPAMAVHALDYIKKSLLAGGNNPRYKGPPMDPLSDGEGTKAGPGWGYAHWKHKVSYFRGAPLMRLTGATLASLGIRTSAGGKTVITVNGDYVGPSAAPGVPGVKVSDYVYVHEYGSGGVTGKIPGRPIITGSMLGWIATQSDAWRIAFQRLMREIVWMKRDRGGKEDLADDIIIPRDDEDDSSSGNSAIDVLANINRQADRLDNLAKTVSRVAADLVYKTARAAPLTPTQKSQLKPILFQELASSGYNSDKIAEIVEIAFGGRIPREYIYD